MSKTATQDKAIGTEQSTISCLRRARTEGRQCVLRQACCCNHSDISALQFTTCSPDSSGKMRIVVGAHITKPFVVWLAAAPPASRACDHGNLAYSARASLTTGTAGSASFHN